MSMLKISEYFNNTNRAFISYPSIFLMLLMVILATSCVGTYDYSILHEAINNGRSGETPCDQSPYTQKVDPVEYAKIINKDPENIKKAFSKP